MQASWKPFRTLFVVTMVGVIGVGVSGCRSPLTRASDRIDHCEVLQRQAYSAKKHTEQELRTACAKWEGEGQLDDSGKWSGKQTKTG